MFQLEDNVPIPTDARRNSGMDKYGFGRMNVNQSFFAPFSDDYDLSNGTTVADLRTRINNAARKYGRENGKKFLVQVAEQKQIVDPEATIPTYQQVQGVRVWRLEDPKPAVAETAAAA